MKRALVVYESLFGDARTIAHSVAQGIGAWLPAEAVEARRAPAVVGPDVALLVVGGPNHRTGMPVPSSRRQAVRDFGAVLADDRFGLREWLGGLRVPHGGILAAAFDTRLDHPGFLRHIDHASRVEERLLRRCGLAVLGPAEHFFVTTATGPLTEGELARARRCGRTLAERVLGATAERLLNSR